MEKNREAGGPTAGAEQGNHGLPQRVPASVGGGGGGVAHPSSEPTRGSANEKARTVGPRTNRQERMERPHGTKQGGGRYDRRCRAGNPGTSRADPGFGVVGRDRPRRGLGDGRAGHV